MAEETEQVDGTEEVTVDMLREEVGSITHDLNNHLTAVMGYTDILRAKLTDETLLEYANMASKSAETMAELTQRLLGTCRGEKRP